MEQRAEPITYETATPEQLAVEGGAGQRASLRGVVNGALGGAPLLAFGRSGRGRDVRARGATAHDVGHPPARRRVQGFRVQVLEHAPEGALAGTTKRPGQRVAAGADASELVLG